MKSLLAFLAASVLAVSAVAADSPDPAAGADLYKKSCAACHASGVAGAPKLGDKAAWDPLIAEGMGVMMHIAINGKGAMPPRGASSASDDELRNAVLYMIAETDPDALKSLDVNAEPSTESAKKPAAEKAGEEQAAEKAGEEQAGEEKAGEEQAGEEKAGEEKAGEEKAGEEEAEADEQKTDGAAKPDPQAGAELYKQSCAACHATGVAGAPKVGDKAAWDPRIAEGMGVMMHIAINGKGAMPPRGASSASDDELRNAVLYMVSETDPDALKTLDVNAKPSAGGGEQPAAEKPEGGESGEAAAGAESDTGEVDLAAGEKAYKATCAACHGDDGNSTVPTQPTLAQQFPEYTAKQLHEFKSGKRTDAIMQAMAAPLSDADIRNISAWLGQQKAKPGFAKDADLIKTGQSIYRGGLANRKIPACAACHSPNGAGIPSQYPRLAGQFAEYTAKQLKDFGDNSRANSDVMHDIAIYMTASEIDAVSDYISGLR